MRIMDIDGDGQISLDELEHYMKEIKRTIKETKMDNIDCEQVPPICDIFAFNSKQSRLN